MSIEQLLKERSGIRLDIGCGAAKQDGFVGLDVRPLDGVDIVWDINRHPWPLPDESVLVAFSSHVVEHIPPVAIGPDGTWFPFVAFMDEVWRVLKPDGEFAVACPHGYSSGYLQDPTHCLPEGAEVLTINGFKDMRDVKVEEPVLTMSLEDGTTEFSPCLKVIHEWYEGEMIEFRNRSMHIMVTPNHDLVWKTWQPIDGYHKSPADTFERVGAFARRGVRTISDWKGDSPGWINGDWMELVGWILSEGSSTQKGNYKRMLIHQSREANHEKHDRILALLDRLNLEYRVHVGRQIYIKSDKLFDEFSPLGKSHEKYIPLVYKNQSPDLLFRMLESLLLGDGEAHPNGGGNTYTSTSVQLAADVQEVALKCGMVSKTTKRKGKAFWAPNGKEYTRRDQYRVSITDERPFLYPKSSRVDYEGNIVCVKVAKNNTILTRFNGYAAWMGNCNAINEATWAYFDPLEPNTGGMLYRIYKPKPWKIKHLSWSPAANMEVVLIKRRLDVSYE